jgi:hypothetical protein
MDLKWHNVHTKLIENWSTTLIVEKGRDKHKNIAR